VHRWLGLTAGLLLAVIGLTGAALVFRDEIDRALNPHLLRVAPAATRAAGPLQAAVDVAARAYPGEPPTRVRMPRTADGTLEVWLGGAPSRYAYVDPYRGTLLGARRPTEFLTGVLFLTHTTLLAGEAGHLVAGACGLVLVLLGASGLVVWWPGRGRLRAATTVTWGANRKRVVYELHRSVGFYASGLLALAGVTGASLVFHAAFQGAIYWAARAPAAPPAPRATSPDAGAALPIDSLVAVAGRAQPGGAISYLYLPTGPGESFRVRQRLAPELHPNGKSFVHLDPRTGAVLAVEDGAAAPLGARAYSALYPLHIGAVWGRPTRVLALVVGLTPALFFVTGVAMWRGRGRRARSP
jgi:uncharacterized iron-regulated membrane protein